jgi:hypothetical protein
MGSMSEFWVTRSPASMFRLIPGFERYVRSARSLKWWQEVKAAYKSLLERFSKIWDQISLGKSYGSEEDIAGASGTVESHRFQVGYSDNMDEGNEE